MTPFGGDEEMYPCKTHTWGDIIHPLVIMYSYEMNYFIDIAFSQSKAEGGGQYGVAQEYLHNGSQPTGLMGE